MTTCLLDTQLALITGAASGIGRAIALACAQAGARVIAVDLTREACLPTLQALEAAEPGTRAWAFALDVTDEAACAALADQVTRDIGPIHVLVNSAGILVREGIDAPHAGQTARRVMDVNLFGSFNVIQAWLPALRATRGCIVNIASGAALRAQSGCVGYSASKGAVKMLTQSMAVDLARDGIRVNAIAPGVIDTPMTEATRNDPVRLQKFVSRIPLARVGRPEEIAGPAVFLASAMASYVNGVTLLVDGGAQA